MDLSSDLMNSGPSVRDPNKSIEVSSSASVDSSLGTLDLGNDTKVLGPATSVGIPRLALIDSGLGIGVLDPSLALMDPSGFGPYL